MVSSPSPTTSSAATDKLASQAANTPLAAGTYDQAERKKLYSDFMKQDYDQSLMVYMWFQKNNWLHSNKVKNFVPGNSGYWDLSKVWLE